eukprot:1154951-Pelagomonas_calceolata.AAC.1
MTCKHAKISSSAYPVLVLRREADDAILPAMSNEVGPWPADSNFDQVSDECGQEDGTCQANQCSIPEGKRMDKRGVHAKGLMDEHAGIRGWRMPGKTMSGS